MEGLTVGRIRGIEVRLHWSLVLVVFLLAWSLAETLFPDLEPGYSTSEYWTAALISSCALFAALLAHELGHAFAAAREHISVRRISLWLFGGLAELEAEPRTPGASFRVAVTGPAVSLLVGGVAFAISFLLAGLTGAAIFWFGVANLSLAIFNLLPAYPLDGGRIYQAWQWKKTGDPVRATRNAAAVGLAMGAFLIVLGIFQVIAGGTLGGVWLMMIGQFVREAARHERSHRREQQALAQVLVGDIMGTDPHIVHPDLSLDDFVAVMFFGGRHAAYPVGRARTEISGMITLNAVRRQSPERLIELRVADIMTPLDRIITTAPEQPVTSLFSLIESDDESRALVFDRGELVGIVSPSDVARLVSVVDIAAATLELPSEERTQSGTTAH